MFHIAGKVEKRALLLTVRFSLILFLSTALLASGCSKERAEDKFKRLMDSAENYKKEGKFNEARIELQSAIDVKPKEANAYFKLAEVLVRLQRISQAVENYNTAINYNPDHREARLHLAAILLANRQYELAENHIAKVLELNPEDNEGRILKANLEAAGPRKNLEEARRLLKDVLARTPDSTAALASLGHIELASGNIAEAEVLLSKAARAEPANAPLQIALADLYTREGRMEEAEAVFEALLKQNPEQSGLHFIFGEFLLNRGMSDKAFQEYMETLKSDPKRHDARDRLYDMYVVRGKIKEARELTAALIAKLPDDPGVHYFRGRDAELDGKHEDALAHFLESIKLLNAFAPAFRRAGLAELRLGRETAGVEHLNQAIAIDPGETSARLALAQRLFARRELGQATEHLNQILARQPRHLAANVLRADIALIQGETESARKVYEFLINEFPKDPAGYFKLGLLEEKNKNFAEAAKWYRETLKFDSGVLLPAQRLIMMMAAHEKKDLPAIIAEMEDWRGKSAKAKAEYDLILGSLTLSSARDRGQLQKARELFERAVEEKPDLIGAYFGLARIDAATGELDAAANNYQKLLDRNPKHVPTLMMLALTREQQQRYAEAAEVYRRILAVSGRFGPAANNLAWLLAEELNGDLDEALRLAELAKERLPKEASVADTLAWVHFKRGSTRAALPILEEALELERISGQGQKQNPEMLYHLAEIRAALGEKNEARQALQKARELAGKDHPKRKKMEELQSRLQQG